MLAAEQTRFTEDEYFERERRSEAKHELVNGLFVAMAGASPKHNAVAVNVATALKTRLRGQRCMVFNSDQRVHVEATGLYTYPDVTVACDGLRFHPKYPDTLVNPKILVEVLSSSTEAYDRGAKFAHYRAIPSFVEYVLVSQEEEEKVEHYRRLDTGQWILTEYKGDASLELPALGLSIPLAEIYEGLELLAPTPPDFSRGRS